MAIPGPGTAISINTIATEFGGTTPHSISEYYRGGGLVPNTPGNAAIPTSGQIALGDFYGSANRTAYTITISASTTNYDAYTNRGPAYVAGASDITYQINPGVIISSNTIPAYAFSVPNSFSPGDTVTIVNNGTIYGAGGTGGAGGPASQGGSSSAGSTGVAGGNAVYVNRPTTITNNATIAAGGGGGGGGGGRYGTNPPSGKNPPTETAEGGGGGGGGAGTVTGSGGSGGAAPPGPGFSFTGSPGSGGTATTGGSGGSGGGQGPTLGPAGPGGSGGGLGAAGSTGSAGSQPGGAGGAAGNYITGNSFVTWPATGTRQGGVA